MRLARLVPDQELVRMVVSCYLWAGNQTQAFHKKSECSKCSSLAGQLFTLVFAFFWDRVLLCRLLALPQTHGDPHLSGSQFRYYRHEILKCLFLITEN